MVQMKLLRVKQASAAAGRRSGLLLPEPTLAAVVMTMAWETTSIGHDVDLAVGACLGAHAHLRRGEFRRISWEWVTSDGSGNPAIVPASGRGVQSLQDGRTRRDFHH